MRNIYKIFIALFVLILVFIIYYIHCYINIGSAYLAKYVCSSVFVSGQTHEVAVADAVLRLNLFKSFDITIDHEEKTVSASLLGLAKRTAVFREGLGATLLYEMPISELKRQSEGWKPPPAKDLQDHPWPYGDAKRSGSIDLIYNMQILNKVIDDAFSEPDNLNYPRNTYAVIIVHKKQMIAERYAKGITPNTPLIGWSMSKSVINALIGILVKEGKLNLSMNPPIPVWQNDARKRKITWNHLLQMISGLDSNEDYGDPFSSILQMLFNSEDMGLYAAGYSMIAEPGARWYYSSGTTNIIATCIKTILANNLYSYWTFPYEKLFRRIGMNNVIFEVDESGSFVGSSYVFASARDWAHFGLLYLNNGRWNDDQILPEDWVVYTTTPVTSAPEGKYGAHFWLNAGEKNNIANRWLPELPQDLFAARGHDGQYLTIIPSLDLVVVRLGNTPFPQGWSQTEFLKGIIKAISLTNTAL